MDTSPRQNLAMSAYTWLKRDIIRGIHPPDTKLLMSGLKKRYELGTGPLREALSQLVAERLVTAASQRGYRVAPMSVEELEDIYDARAQLEGLIVQLAIERGDDAWEAEILARAHTLNKVVDVSGPDEVLAIWDQRHKAFHAAIAAGCGTHHLQQVRESLFDQAERYRHLWLCETVFSSAAIEQKRGEHDALVEAILARDSSRAVALMREHLLTPVPIISEVMRSRGLA